MGSDEDENPFEIDGPEAELAIEALMGWDGEPCACPCGCQRFRDTPADDRCTPCIEGRHWVPAERLPDGGR